jgi:hypothetical protein
MSVASRTWARSDHSTSTSLLASPYTRPWPSIAHAHSTGRARVSDLVRHDAVATNAGARTGGTSPNRSTDVYRR